MGRADAAVRDAGGPRRPGGAGKVHHGGCSNYAGWQLMKALGVAERDGPARFVSQQIHYTLQARVAEYELLPISLDQGLGVLVWSPPPRSRWPGCWSGRR